MGDLSVRCSGADGSKQRRAIAECTYIFIYIIYTCSLFVYLYVVIYICVCVRRLHNP